MQRQSEAQPSPFASRGLGRFVNRNANGLQFNKPAVMQATHSIIDSYYDAKYFRDAGMGAALRHSLGMGQVPSHRRDDINTRRRTLLGQNVAGINPGYVGAGESAASFNIRHGLTEEEGRAQNYAHW